LKTLRALRRSQPRAPIVFTAAVRDNMTGKIGSVIAPLQVE
jgi:hypothetical protein